MKYQLHGLRLKSNMELTGLATACFDSPDITFELRTDREQNEVAIPSESQAISVSFPDGSRFVELHQLPSTYVMRFHKGLDFWMSADGSKIVCYADEGISTSAVQQYLLGWVVSLVLSLKHMVGLHASAVVADGKAVGFVGSSGAGKSTLVTAMAMAGYELLTDEVLVFKLEGNEVIATPGYREVRLAPETLSDLGRQFRYSGLEGRESFGKRALLADGTWANLCQESVPLAGLYILDSEDSATRSEVISRSLDPKDAPRHLLRHSFIVPKWYREFLNRQFEMLCRLCGIVPVRTLTFPRGLHQMPDVVASIMDLERRRDEMTGRELCATLRV